MTSANLVHGLAAKQSKDGSEVVLISQPGPFRVGGHEACDAALTQAGSGTGYVMFLQQRASRERE